MNIKIDHQKLRFRLSKAECEHLFRHQSFEQTTHFQTQQLKIILVIKDITPDLVLSFGDDTMTLYIKTLALKNLLENTPSKKGLEVIQNTTQNSTQNSLHLTLEIDVFKR